jgi:nitrogen regulatory protein PII
METINKKMMTIITEQNLEKSIIHDLEGLGIEGYTIVQARGKGDSGVKSGTWMNDSNIQIELILDDSLAVKIYNYISDTKKYDNYSMMVYLSDVNVLKRH